MFVNVENVTNASERSDAKEFSTNDNRISSNLIIEKFIRAD